MFPSPSRSLWWFESLPDPLERLLWKQIINFPASHSFLLPIRPVGCKGLQFQPALNSSQNHLEWSLCKWLKSKQNKSRNDLLRVLSRTRTTSEADKTRCFKLNKHPILWWWIDEHLMDEMRKLWYANLTKTIKINVSLCAYLFIYNVLSLKHLLNNTRAARLGMRLKIWWSNTPLNFSQ